uniref:NAD(P)H-quinone oxidoreductase subunit 4L, chloroplastic n=1 Tax=Nephroselmis astigmatica TaxID=259378 RepID=A0A088CKB5_9CHLO|nr:subunit 4L of NADH-plastoquinone oxidoreductase [Nephroselmis astigmatica]AID67679.1 subunit 4L of NADH-plastoquinone oxidoreductase [Nephroselmis astigmatica]
MILSNCLLLAACLFIIGLYGLLTSQNVIRIFMSIELLFNAVNLNFVAFSSFLDSYEIQGQVFAIFVITIAAAEAAIGLAIILSIYRTKESVDIDSFNLLKW